MEGSRILEEKIVEKQCAGCDNIIVSELEKTRMMDWYVLVADGYCRSCIEEKPARVLCKTEMVKVARERKH